MALASRASGVCVLCLEPGAWYAASEALQALLSPAELTRVQRKRRAQDRDLLTVAYAFHRLAVAEVLALDVDAVRIERDAQGCPRLPDDVCRTSLSHCEDAVAVAIARHGPVGVDVEPVRRAEGMLALAAQVCSANELRRCNTLPVASRERELLRLWVCKEAVLKALGVGLARAMASVDIDAQSLAHIDEDMMNVMQLYDLSKNADLFLMLAAARGEAVSLAWV